MKRDKASFFALLAAAVILGSVGIKSYFDYRLAVETKSAPSAPAAAPGDPAVTHAAAQPAGNSADAEEKIAETATIGDLPRSVLPPIPDAILNPPPPSTSPTALTKSGDTGMGKAPVPAASQTPAPSSAEVETLRQESALLQQKLDQLRSGSAAASAVTAAPLTPAPLSPATALPATPNSALQAALSPEAAILAPEPGAGGAIPPPGIPGSETPPPTAAAAEKSQVEIEAEIAALAEQVKRQPAIAKVTFYDNALAVVALDGGEDRNLKPEMRLAVRRGAEILGFITIEEVGATESVAKLTSKNRESPTARKPSPGDDVIAFNFF